MGLKTFYRLKAVTLLAAVGFSGHGFAIDATPVFSGSYGDQTCTINGGVLTGLHSSATSNGYAGCANDDSSLAPFGFSSGDKLVVTGKIAPVGGESCTSNDVRVLFEANPYPDNSPNFTSPSITLTASSATTTVDLTSGEAATQPYNVAALQILGKDCTVEISSILIQHSGIASGPATQPDGVTVGGAKPTKGTNDLEGINFGAFGGASNSGESYTVDWTKVGDGVETYAGFSKNPEFEGAWRFPNGGKLYFTGQNIAGNNTVKFVFEKAAYPNVEPKFDTGFIILESGTKNYLVDIPARPSGEAYASFLMYFANDGTNTTNNITNVGVYGIEPLTDCAPTEKFVFDGIFGGSEVQGHKVETGDCDAPPKYIVKKDAETWAGFADSKRKEDFYPLSFPDGGKINFKGKGKHKVYFVLQDKPDPATRRSFTTAKIALDENTAGNFSVTIPAREQAWDNFLMYIEKVGTADEDSEVEVWDVTLEGNVPYVPPEKVPSLSLGGVLGLAGLIAWMGVRRRRR